MLRRPFEFTQYTSLAFGQRCRAAGVRPSMGSIGDGFDNAMCESCFATLECELLDRCRFKTQVEARMAIFDFIEGWYNPHRRHSALADHSPIEYEQVNRGATNRTVREAPTTRTAGPPKNAAAGALHSVVAAEPKPFSLPAPPSDRTKGGTEKLQSDKA